MINRVGRILVGDGANSAATFAALENMAAGDLALVGENNVPILAAAATITDNPVVRFVQCIAAGTYRFSLPIQGRNIRRAAVRPYAAPALQVMTVTFNNVINNAEYRLMVTINDRNPFLDMRPTKMDLFYNSDATATDAEIAAAFALRINRNKFLSPLMTASAAAGVLTLTAKAVPQNQIDQFSFVAFQAAATVRDAQNNIVSAANEVVTTAASAGTGSAAQVRDIEREMSGYVGFSNYTTWPIPAAPFFHVAGANYDLITIDHDNLGLAGMQQPVFYPQTTLIAVPTGSAQRTYLDTIVDPYVTSAGFVYP